MDALLRIEDVTKIFGNGSAPVIAVNRVSLEVNPGEVILILGPSGSGKTTLLSIMGGLMHPTSGEVYVNGQNIYNLSDQQLCQLRCRHIGFVFQSFNLLSRHSALENVELPLLYAGFKDAEALARKALETVGLSHRVAHRPNELSGGERQRVAIARAIVTDPPIIVGDEPTGNLDTRTGAEIMKFLKQLHEKGTTLIIVTHDPEIAGHCDRVINIRDGRIQDA